VDAQCDKGRQMIVNRQQLPVYHTKYPTVKVNKQHVAMIDLPWQIFPSPEFLTEFQRAVGLPLFLEVPEFPYNKISCHRDTVQCAVLAEMLQSAAQMYNKPCKSPLRSFKVTRNGKIR